MQVIVPRGNRTRSLIELLDKLDRVTGRKNSRTAAASYQFRNQYFFTDTPPPTAAAHTRPSAETSNLTYFTHRTKVKSLTTVTNNRANIVWTGGKF